MSELLTHRFDRIVKENLAKRKEMTDVLIGSALDADLFNRKGTGLKTILSKTGRVTDFKGIYGFVEKGKVVYLDESSYVIKRILRHYKGTSKYQLKLAHIILNVKKEKRPTYSIKDALNEMAKMKILFLDLPDDLERQLTTLYLQCQYECVYNRFD